MKVGVAYESEQWQKSHDEGAALWEQHRNDPQYTPEEIQACYGDLRNEGRRKGILSAVGKEKKTNPTAMHISKFLNYLEKIRTQEDELVYSDLKAIYPKESKADLLKFFKFIVLQWGVPVSGAQKKIIDELLEDSDPERGGSGYSYEYDLWKNFKALSPSYLDIVGKRYLQRLSALKKEPVTVASRTEQDMLERALETIDCIQYALEGDSDGLWNALKSSGSRTADVAADWYRYLKLFTKKAA